MKTKMANSEASHKTMDEIMGIEYDEVDLCGIVHYTDLGGGWEKYYRAEGNNAPMLIKRNSEHTVFSIELFARYDDKYEVSDLSSTTRLTKDECDTLLQSVWNTKEPKLGEHKINLLAEEEMCALDALIPLMKDDGEIHKTTTIPPMAYQSPLHLDYVCSKLPENHSKLERLKVISRILKVRIIPLGRLKRHRSRSGEKSQWSLLQHDPFQRMSAPYIPWAKTGDEYSIFMSFNGLVRKIIRDDIEGMEWWLGGNSDVHSGRFWPIPKTEEAVEEMRSKITAAFEPHGFTVLFVESLW